MAVAVLGLLAVLAFTTALPTPENDKILVKPPGPRYTYFSTPEGPRLVDMWLKTSDIAKAARFNPDINNVYHLFTRSNPTTSQPIPMGNTGALWSSNFNANRKTVFLVHGWWNNPTSDFNVHLTRAYVQAQDVNLIMVDWSIGAGVDYWIALGNVVRSGEHVARYINWLNGASGANINNYHIIGHSLGGHQAGIIGRNLNGRVPYITALDPALPGWITNSNSFRSTDGIYTEVMHTDAGLQGMLSAIGDVDFYPNGGSNMAGCSDSHCNHHRCIFYMAESLTRGGFTGRRCNNLNEAISGSCNQNTYLRMGGVNPKTGSTGIYHLTTNANSPYSQW